jgi:molybdate transport system substrate-binding protein
VTGAQRGLYLLSAGAAKGLVEGFSADFHRATGAVIRGTFGAVGTMRERLLDGEPCDAFVSTKAMLDALAGERRIVDGSIRAIGSVRTGVAVRAGEPSIDVSTGEALAARLREASAIYVPDTERATAGIHFVRVLDRLGLLGAVAGKLRTYPNGATAMQRLAREGPPGAIGCTQATEILYTPGVVLAGLLPDEYELSTEYAAGVCAGATDAALASDFVAWIAGERAATLRRAGGFEG